MKQIAELIKQGNVVFFCGAGLSAESGVPTFRGKDGLWEKYDPRLYVTEDGLFSRLVSYPFELSNFIVELYTILLDAKPNRAHFYMADWEKKGWVNGVITQNIDDFHVRAGSVNVAQIHGNAYTFVCRKGHHAAQKSQDQWRKFLDRIRFAPRGRDIIREILRFSGRCPECKRRLESGIVLFGQQLPEAALSRSYELINSARTVICVGSSGVVYPAAALPYQAKEKGAKIINVNPEATPLDDIAHEVFRQSAVEFFQKLSLLL